MDDGRSTATEDGGVPSVIQSLRLGLTRARQTPFTPKPHFLDLNFPANASGMSTAAEIEAAIRELPEAEARAVAQWLQEWHV